MTGAATPPGGFTVLRTVGKHVAAKTWTRNQTDQQWVVHNYNAGTWFTAIEKVVTSLDELHAAIMQASADPRCLIVRGELRPEIRETVQRRASTTIRRLKWKRGDTPPSLQEAPRQWVMIDIDKFPLRPSDDLVDDPEAAVAHAIDALLPPAFGDVRCFFQLSSSAGFVAGILKCHLFFWLSAPVDDATLEAVLKQHAPTVDAVVCRTVQPHYVAAPVVKGGVDPIPRRFGWVKGMGDAVTLPMLAPSPPHGYAASDTASPAAGGNFADIITQLGDGPGCHGFHRPLLAATMRYALDCWHSGRRDDAAIIEVLRAAIQEAPRDPQREIDYYLDTHELQRLIDGAFEWLLGDARRLVEESVPLDGTEGEYHAKQTWGIRRPAAGWPDTVRWHPAYCAVPALITRDNGILTGVLRVPVYQGGTAVVDGVRQDGFVRLGAPGAHDAPLLLATSLRDGLAGYTATGHETWVALSDFCLPPPAGRRILILSTDTMPAEAVTGMRSDRILRRWRTAGMIVVSVTPWADRRHDGSNFADLILAEGPEAVLGRIQGALEAAEAEAQRLAAVPTKPHYPRGSLRTDATAARLLQRAMRAYLDRVEHYLYVRDWIAAEALRLLPEIRVQCERRIYAKLLRRRLQSDPDGFGAEERDLAEVAAERATRVAGQVARRAARRIAAVKFGRRAAEGKMPRYQIKGAAGLGKTRGFIAEYLRRPTLWKRNIEFYARDLALGAEFAASVHEAALEVPIAADGSRPRVLVIHGRNAEGMCHPDRLPLVKAVEAAGIDSIYRTCCFTPAFEFKPELSCPYRKSCGYLAQFDSEPALRVLPHAQLPIRQPSDLRLPDPDLVVIDETAISTLVATEIVEPMLLTERATYAAHFGDGDRVRGSP